MADSKPYSNNEKFQAGHVVLISVCHFIHDIYSTTESVNENETPLLIN